MSAEQMRLLADAHGRARKLRRTTTTALLSAIGLASFAGLSLLWCLGEFAIDRFAIGQLDWLGFVMGGGLAVAAWNEFRGRRLLQAFDPRGPRVLGFNQLALCGLIVAYAAWMMGVALWGPNPYAEIIAREPLAARTLNGVAKMYRLMSVAVYGALIAGTLLFQGLTAAYYFSRGKLLRRYLDETPDWVVDVQQATKQ